MPGFQEGQRVWVEQPDGTWRPGIFVGEAGNASWFGGQPDAHVVYPDTKSGAEVSVMRITPREDEGDADAPGPG